MAFAFGQSQPASSPFTFNSTPAFGASSAPAFGAASSASLFGAASTPSLFGASSSSLFGGAVSTPAFGGFGGGASSAATSLFGATSAPAFGAAASSPSLFGGGGATPGFGASPSLFGGSPAPGAGGGALSLFPSAQQQQQQYQQQQSLQQEQQLVTKDNHPINHSTKWDDLSPQAQQYLLELEKVIAQGRDECRQLDGEERLQGNIGSRQAFGEATQNLSRGIAAVHAMVHADTIDAGALRNEVLHLLRHTEAVLSSFKRTHAWREASKTSTGQALPSHVVEQLGGPVALPSPFLSAAIKDLEDKVKVQRAAAADLALALQRRSQHKEGPSVNAATALQSLQAAMSNLQDCLVHAAARLQTLDEKVGAAKEVYLKRQRQVGDYANPFTTAEQDELTRNRQRSKVAGGGGGAKESGGGQTTGISSQGVGAHVAPASGPTGLFGTVSPPPASGFGTPGTGLFGDAANASTRRKGKR